MHIASIKLVTYSQVHKLSQCFVPTGDHHTTYFVGFFNFIKAISKRYKKGYDT
jgi:hypothetical protein